MRYFVYSGSFGMTHAVSVDTDNNVAYFQFRDEEDVRWQHAINCHCKIQNVSDRELSDYIKKLVGNPFPIFMEFEGKSAEAFGLVRDTEALINNAKKGIA